jgi:hypothetical protein
MKVEQQVLTHSSTMKMEAVGTSRTLVPIYQTTQHNIPEGCNLSAHHCEYIRAHEDYLIEGFCYLLVRDVQFQPYAASSACFLLLLISCFFDPEDGGKMFV